MKRKSSSLNGAGIGCLMLFALPFACVGGFMGWRFVSSILTWRDASQWVETQATLTSLKLGKNSDSDGGTTYKAKANYRYQYQGKDYQGDRVGLFSGSDNIGNYQRKTHARLKRLKKQGKPVPCFVNPSDPKQALLDREMRVGMLTFHIPFVLMFGGFGFGAIGYGIPLLNQWRGRRQLAKQFPDEPWRWRTDWERGVVRHSGRGKVLAWLLAATFWNLVCGTTLAVALLSKPTGTVLMLVIIGINVAGAGLALVAVYQLWRMLRYGVSELEFAQVPGVIGGRLVGVVKIPAKVEAADGFLATLLCQEQRTTRGSDGESSTTMVTVWESERKIARTLDSGDPRRTAVPLAFTIPSSAKQTDPNANAPISWKVKLSAQTPGPDYHAEFEVPVFITPDSQDGVEDEAEPLSEYEAVQSLETLLARENIRCSPASDDPFRVVSPPFRKPLAGMGFIALAIILGVAAYFFYTQVSWIPGVGLAVFTVVMLYVAIEQTLASSELKITGERWQSRSGWYGLRKTRRFTVDQIKSIRCHTVVTSQSGTKSTKWNHVKVKLKQGKSFTLVTYLSSRSVEKALLTELRDRAGLDRKRQARKDEASEQWQDVMDLPAEE